MPVHESAEHNLGATLVWSWRHHPQGWAVRHFNIIVNGRISVIVNSQLLSTATDGQGVTINIASPLLLRIGDVIDASSQSGTDGAVTNQQWGCSTVDMFVWVQLCYRLVPRVEQKAYYTRR